MREETSVKCLLHNLPNWAPTPHCFVYSLTPLSPFPKLTEREKHPEYLHIISIFPHFTEEGVRL